MTSTITQIDRTNVFHARIFVNGKPAREAKITGYLAADRWVSATLAEYAPDPKF